MTVVTASAVFLVPFASGRETLFRSVVCGKAALVPASRKMTGCREGEWVATAGLYIGPDGIVNSRLNRSYMYHAYDDDVRPMMYDVLCMVITVTVAQVHSIHAPQTR